MAFCFTGLNKIIHQWLYVPVETHVAFLNQQIDPIQVFTIGDQQKTSGNAKKSHLYFALLIVIFAAVYGTFGLQYEATNGSSLDSLAALRSSPYIFSHQICPRSIWAQIDIGIWSDICTSICIFIVLIIAEPVDHKARIYQLNNVIIFGTKELSEHESKKIINYRRRIKFLFQYPTLLFVFCANVCFLGNVFLNSVYSVTTGSVLYWTIIFPLFLFYIVYALFGLLIYIVFASRYFRIRQQSLITSFRQINATLSNVNPQLQNRPIALYLCWRKFAQLNRDSAHLCTVISGQARFCAPLLSVIFPFYITVQCYLIYIVLFVDIPLIQKQIFYLGIAEVNLFLFLIIRECAQIAKRGRQLEVANRKFCFLFYFKGGATFVNKARLVKIETFQAARRFNPFAFKLFGNFRITSKTYHAIITYISGYLLFVFKKL